MQMWHMHFVHGYTDLSTIPLFEAQSTKLYITLKKYFLYYLKTLSGKEIEGLICKCGIYIFLDGYRPSNVTGLSSPVYT